MSVMRTIWKYPLKSELSGWDWIEMPIGSIVRHLATQDGVPTLWVEVDPNQPRLVKRRFSVYGTGHELAAPSGFDLAYVGTWQAPPFVWHLYELIESED